MKNQTVRTVIKLSVVLVFAQLAVFAQDSKPGKLKVKVSPRQAYTFVDDKAIGPGNRTIKLEPGTHHVIVANYGYKFAEKDVSIDSKAKVPLDIKLERVDEKVPGPRGRIQVEEGWHFRNADAAVLLNGKKPQYFVGHVDEFNHNIIWKQELIVPPGTHHVTVTRYGKELWSGDLTVAADQRVIVNISNGKEKTKPWTRGSSCKANCDPTELQPMLARFKAGIASATVVVAPVSGSVSANPPKIDCNQNTVLAWNSKETVEADMSGMSPVPTSGEKTISPRQTTTYQLTASGPGGVVKPSTTVDVNTAVQSSLNVSSAEVGYRRIGDKIVQQDNTTLSWSTTNADAVSLDVLGGTVETNGTRSLTPTPKQSSNGQVDEVVQYTLTATNVCGGSDTKTVSVHLKGSIEPVPNVVLQSVFFPTDYPTKQDPELGLLRSQQEVLTKTAADFKHYLEYDPDAKLSLGGYTDERGPNDHNQSLSEMRAQRVKEFLVSQGIAEDKIDTSAYGKQKQLDKSAISELQTSNPNPPPENRARNAQTNWLAYNRRVDIILIPTKAESERFYPNQAPDVEILWQRPKPPRSKVEENN